MVNVVFFLVLNSGSFSCIIICMDDRRYALPDKGAGWYGRGGLGGRNGGTWELEDAATGWGAWEVLNAER